MNNEIMRNAIEQMSYFNAAEGGAWTREASARNKLQKETAQQAIDAGLSMEEFKAFYNDYVKEHGRGLTTFWDFGYSYKILKENQIMGEAKEQNESRA